MSHILRRSGGRPGPAGRRPGHQFDRDAGGRAPPHPGWKAGTVAPPDRAMPRCRTAMSPLTDVSIVGLVFYAPAQQVDATDAPLNGLGDETRGRTAPVTNT